MHCKHRKMEHIGFIILISYLQCLSACDFIVTIDQKLTFEGFHRNMTYDINMGHPNMLIEEWGYKDCVVGLHQHLPPGIYANPDELNDLRRSHRLNAITKKTNVEMPAELSEPMSVYIIKKMSSPSVQAWVPLHSRYHKAVRNGGFALNEIEAPQMFMRCPQQKLDNCETPLTPVKFLCSGSNSKEKCNWKEIPVNMGTKTPIAWQVPVGDLHHYYQVAIGTGLAVVAGSMYLLYTIHEFKFIYQYSN